MSQGDLFGQLPTPAKAPPARSDMDARRGEVRKGAGQDAAAAARADMLALARTIARGHARRHGRVTADDVQAALIAGGHDPAELGNAAGSVFRGAEWQMTGEYVRSRRASNKARTLPVWELIA